MSERLYGERVILDDLRDEDAQRIFEICSSPEAEELLETPWPYTLKSAQDFIAWATSQDPEDEHSERTWAIREKPDGVLAGVIGIRPDLRNVGYYLHRDARGRGLMTDATRRVVQYAFETLGWQHVLWQSHPGNVASARVARAVGFHYVGTRGSLSARRDNTYAMEWTAQILAEGKTPDDAEPWPAALDA